MPKSNSTIQGQIKACEMAMSEAMEICTMTAGTEDFQFTFNMKKFMNEITTIDLEHTKIGLTKVLEVFNHVDKIMQLETKIRKYVSELHEKITNRDRKETLKKVRIGRSLRRAKTFQLTLPTSSQESIDNNDN